MKNYVALLLGAALATAGAQGTVTVRGFVWDSLRKAPLVGAFVSISGASRSATSDALGYFQFEGVAPGDYTFAMQHDVLESIGFSGRSVRATIDAFHPTVDLAVPSFETLWRALCGTGGTVPQDSAIVYGVVRDSVDTPLAGMPVGVTWRMLKVTKSAGIDWKDMGGRVTSSASGRYALCGVPTDVVLHIGAGTETLTSGIVDVEPVRLRVARRDLRLTPATARRTP